MVLGSVCTAVAATEEPPVSQGFADSSIIEGSKTAEEIDEGEYEVTVSVPGVDTEIIQTEYNEVIVMVDSSSSQWKNLAALQDTLKELGQKLLTKDGKTHLTLMSFGFSPNTVMTATTPDDIESLVSSLTPKGMLYGRSATNCEVAFNWIKDYVNGTQSKTYESDKSEGLKEAVVIFTSDGFANMSEKPFVWDWANNPKWNYLPVSRLAEITAYIQEQCVAEGGFLPTTERLYPELTAEYKINTTTDAAIKAITAAMTADADSSKKFLEEFWNDMFAYSNLDPANEYTSSEFEHVLWEYLRSLPDCYLEVMEPEDEMVLADVPLCLIFKCPNISVDQYNRAARACDELAESQKVKSVNIFSFPRKDGSIKESWMNPENTDSSRVTNKKITYKEGDSFAEAMDNLVSQIEETIMGTPVNRPVVTDPMSKWVILDEDSLAVSNDGEIIWTAKDGWLIEEADRPVAGVPVVITENPENGKPVITWTIKDGALVISDRYALTYTVTMDTEAEGYIHGEDYPLNDPTDVTYINEKNETVKVDIDVPDGHTHSQVVTVNYIIDEEIVDSVETEPAAKNSHYDVTECHKDTITKDGKTYVLVAQDGDPEEGSLDSDKVVNLYYEERITRSERKPSVNEETEEAPVVEEIEDNETPLAEAPEEIAEEVAAPVAPAPEDEELEEMPEDPVPLADVPATGDSLGLWGIVAMASACLLMAWTLTCRRKEN